MSLPLTQRSLAKPFIEIARLMPDPVVFELGTKRSIPSRPTTHKEWVPNAKAFLGIDIEVGADVDYVADAHNLSQDLQKYPHKKCDIFISCSTFEHIRNPFVAAQEISKVINPGGILFVQTHQTFPLHAYPHDYWRYTIDSLTYIFTEAHIGILSCAYEYPAQIHSIEDAGTKLHPAFLNVCLIGRK